MRRSRKSVSEVWTRMSAKEKWLLVGSVTYAALVFVYTLRWHSAFLKYGVATLGFALLPLMPELIREKRKGLLVFLVIVIAAGNTAMQILDDRSKDRAIDALKKTVEAQTLVTWKDLNEEEALVKLRDRDTVTETPLDSIENLKNIATGLLRKAERVSVRVALEESRFLSARPDLARQVLQLPDEPQRRLAGYQAMGGASPDLLATLLEEQQYRDAAEYMAKEAVPAYERLEKAMKTGQLEYAEVVARLHAIEIGLWPPLAAYPVASLFNHAGLLAMAQGERDRALGLYYLAVAADASHIPAYETIAYAAWTRQETRSALHYAEKGLELARAYAGRLDDELGELSRNYASVVAQQPVLAPQLDRRREAAATRAAVLKDLFNAGTVTLRDKLELLYAYCSAFELQNEKEARMYAEALYRKAPEDPEYEDALGLVLLRFAKEPTELDRAEELFTRASRSTKAEQITKQLAALHLSNLDVKRRALRSGR